MRCLTLALVAASTLLVAPAAALADAPTSVHGRVVDCRSAWTWNGWRGKLSLDGAKPLRATIVVNDEAGYSHAYKTDAEGRYSFLAPLFGEVYLDVQVQYYDDLFITFDGVAGQSVTVDAYMPYNQLRPISHVDAPWKVDGCMHASAATVNPGTTDQYILH
jgi:hypothetical protein